MEKLIWSVHDQQLTYALAGLKIRLYANNISITAIRTLCYQKQQMQ